jgi:uncharacterized repeat protein (TIGR03803 family)
VLYTFTGGDDGAEPFGLILSGATLYGATSGSSSNDGTIFAINTDGSGFAVLHTFTAGLSVRGYYPGNFDVLTNSDGANPSTLVLSGNTLCGTTRVGGPSGSGTVFKLNTDGTGFTSLYAFTGSTTNSSGDYINIDGSHPLGGLILSGNTVYGTTVRSGPFDGGTVFALNTDGTGFEVVHNFTVPQWPKLSVGAAPPSRLILSSNILYGTAIEGGIFDPNGFGSWPDGFVFSVSLLPQLTITPAGPNVVLGWPTNYAGFDYTGFALESTANLNLPVWKSNLPAPEILNGQKSVTVPVTGTQQFFRLRQ